MGAPLLKPAVPIMAAANALQFDPKELSSLADADSLFGGLADAALVAYPGLSMDLENA